MSVLQHMENALPEIEIAPRHSYKQIIASWLDFPGNRFLLGKMATAYAQRLTGEDIGILYWNGFWTHRAGKYFFPDGPRFNYTALEFREWKLQAGRYLADANDYWFVHYTPKEGDTVIDVGAGRGEDTLAFSRLVGKTGRVIAIEAHPLSFAILKNFCSLNGLTNVTPLNVAAMDSAGGVGIVEAPSWIENSVERGKGGAGIQIPATTLDDVWCKQGLGEVAFLKMNIEGAEQHALPGMRSMIRHVNQLCIACHDFRYAQGHGEQFRTRAFVQSFLSDNGFELRSRPDDPRLSVPDHIFGVRSGAVRMSAVRH